MLKIWVFHLRLTFNDSNGMVFKWLVKNRKVKLNINWLFVLVVCVLSPHLVLAQDTQHSIQVFFLYGSKPAKGYSHIEKREFGGLHGGHVNIGIDSFVIGFHHVLGYHVFARKKNFMGCFEQIRMADFVRDSVSKKYAVFTIPINSNQYQTLKALLTQNLAKTHYDYAFFGMRCAASTYEMLSSIGIVKPRKRAVVIYRNFYPRMLRKQLFRLAKKNNYKYIVQNGRSTRIWEKD